MKGRPHFTVCAAVVEEGRPRAGFVFNPATEECFSARQGGGVFLNGAPIQPSAQKIIEGCRMLAPKSLFQDWPPMQVESYSVPSPIASSWSLPAGTTRRSARRSSATGISPPPI